jgi:hypothetical protein
VIDAILIENAFHVVECSLLKNNVKISMPQSNAGKASPRSGFYTVFEVKSADFTGTWEYSCGCPEEIHQFDRAFHHRAPLMLRAQLRLRTEVLGHRLPHSG